MVTRIQRFKSGIYKITNLVNGKIYVGSSVNVYNRMHTHFAKLKREVHSNKHLQASYLKYGRKAFSFTVLEYCDNFTEREQYFIDTLNPEYNHRLVAQNNLGLKVSEETKKKISITLTDKYKMGLKTYRQVHAWRAVEQYDLEGNYLKTFPNLAEAERAVGLFVGKLSVGVKKSSKQMKGFQWKYVGDDKEILKAVSASGTRSRPVRIFNTHTGELVLKPSLKSASEYLGVNRSVLSKFVGNTSRLYLQIFKIQYQDQYKSCELLESPRG
jgi:group I intron endonuclease